MRSCSIAPTNITKAACLALFNGQRQRAIRMLQNSEDEKHKLMGTLLLQSRVDPSTVSGMHLGDAYLRAMVKSLAGDASWHQIIHDPELPLLERLVLAIRFVPDQALSTFLADQSNQAVAKGSLHGVVLFGLTSTSVSPLLQAYLDRTSDLQTVAIIGATLFEQDDKVGRWIEDYRQLLNGWKLYRARVSFDIVRGEIARSYGRNIETPRQVIVRCNFCQKNVTASHRDRPPNTRPSGHRSNACPTCGNRLPKCAICLMQIEMPQYDGGSYREQGSATAETLTLLIKSCAYLSSRNIRLGAHILPDVPPWWALWPHHGVVSWR